MNSARFIDITARAARFAELLSQDIPPHECIDMAADQGRPGTAGSMTPETQQRVVQDYLAGVGYRDMPARHDVSVREAIRVVKQAFGPQPRHAREAWMQDRIASISAEVGKVFGLRPGAIWGDQCTPALVHARYAAWLVCIEQGISTKAVARAYEMDHSSVLYGRDQARRLAGKMPEFRGKLDAARAAVRMVGVV